MMRSPSRDPISLPLCVPLVNTRIGHQAACEGQRPRFGARRQRPGVEEPNAAGGCAYSEEGKSGEGSRRMSGEWGWEGHAGSMSTVSRQGGLRGPMRALAALVLLSSVLASPPAQHGGLERGSCSLARGGDNHMPAGAAKAVLMAAGRLPLLLPLRGGSSTATLKLERGGSKEVKQAERVSIARTVPLAPGVSMGGKHAEMRTVSVPGPRVGVVKKNWQEISRPIVQHLKLQIRMNLQAGQVEMRTCEMTLDAGAIERGSEFVKAVVTGFSVKDSLSLLRLENIFLKSFDITDVKPLKGDHLTRAVGRIAGTKGKTKQALEANTRTRIVLEGQNVHILGSNDSVTQATKVCSDLIRGRPTAKANKSLRAIAGRLRKEY